MDEDAAVRLPKRADNFPWWLLHVTSHLGAAGRDIEAQCELSVQLMNSRVSSELCRIDPSSGNGVKHETTSFSDWETALKMPGRRFQIIRLAATCPRGMSRWQAEIRAVMDCCR